jgi:hypothetical protein
MATTLGGNQKGIDHFEIASSAILDAINAGYGAAFRRQLPMSRYPHSACPRWFQRWELRPAGIP